MINRLMAGTAVALGLALAASAWAQSPMTPGSPDRSMPSQPSAMPDAASTPSAEEGAAPRRHHAARAHRTRHHAGRASTAARRGGQSNDNVADQLNREEANRVSSGSSAAPSAAPMPPNEAGGAGAAPAPMAPAGGAPTSGAPMR